LAFRFRLATVQLANVARLKVGVAAMIQLQVVAVVQKVAESAATTKKVTVRVNAIHANAIWGLPLTRFRCQGLSIPKAQV
jgi:hypothetical protein